MDHVWVKKRSTVHGDPVVMDDWLVCSRCGAEFCDVPDVGIAEQGILDDCDVQAVREVLYR